MATKSTYIIALVDYFCITDGLISKMEIIVSTTVATPLSHVRHRIGYVPGIKVGSGGRKENVLNSESFHTKDIF